MSDLSVSYAQPAQASGKLLRLRGVRLAPQSDSRRPVSGGAWSLPSGNEPLRQPQDGAIRLRTESPSRVASIEGFLPGGSQAEPEDARLTGSTRSLRRRLLGLNIRSNATVNAVVDSVRKAPALATRAIAPVRTPLPKFA